MEWWNIGTLILIRNFLICEHFYLHAKRNFPNSPFFHFTRTQYSNIPIAERSGAKFLAGFYIVLEIRFVMG